MVTTKKMLAANLEEFQQAYLAADARLDKYGDMIGKMFGGQNVVTNSGRSSSVTNVDEMWSVTVNNVPGAASATFTSLVHKVSPLTVSFMPGRGADFTEGDLAMIEDWVQLATTGVAVDHDRHAKRASALGSLV